MTNGVSRSQLHDPKMFRYYEALLSMRERVAMKGMNAPVRDAVLDR
jgi:hypothetical protein